MSIEMRHSFICRNKDCIAIAEGKLHYNPTYVEFTDRQDSCCSKCRWKLGWKSENQKIYLLTHPCHKGEGNQGSVYKALEVNSNSGGFDTEKIYGIKFLRQTPDKDTFDREINGLKTSRDSGARVPSYIDHYYPQQSASNENATKDAFLVMEFIEGDTLSQRITTKIKENQINDGIFFSEKQIFEYLIDLLETLHLIHKNRIIHRDIKPDNIVVRKQSEEGNFTNNRELYFVDFGICKHLSTDSDTTFTEYQPNTPVCAPPEILVRNRGVSQDIDSGIVKFTEDADLEKYAQTRDIYSLAITVCELISERVHQNIQSSKLANQRHKPHDTKWNYDMKEVRKLAPNIYCIVDKMLRYYPDERYQTAIEVLLDASTQAWYTYEQKDDFWLLQGPFLQDAHNCQIPKTKQHEIFLQTSWDKQLDRIL